MPEIAKYAKIKSVERYLNCRVVDCDKRALKGNPSKFEQLIHGDQYVQMDCPPGLVFVNEICKCDYRKSEPVPTQETGKSYKFI